MKGFTYFLLVLIILTALAFGIPKFRIQVVNIISASKCDYPIKFRLGQVDKQFGLKNSEISTDLLTAANIWNTTYGKKIFIQSSNGELIVNFVYDERAALDTQIVSQKSQLDQKNLTLQQQLDIYQSDIASFQSKLTSYNTLVDKLNKNGGATPEVYDQLLKQQQELSREGDELKIRANKFNQDTRDFNYFVQKLNQNVSEFNNALAQKPEEGLFSGKENAITIYFANNRQELIHTLAHEFGHALSLDHTTDKNSIMYSYSSASNVVTTEDLSQLNFACRKQPYPILWLNSLLNFVYQHN